MLVRPRSRTSLAFVLAATSACASASGRDGDAVSTSASAATTPDLSWVGDTSVAYAVTPAGTNPETDVTVATSFVVAGHDLTVLTDVFPEGSAAKVTLFWANADGSSVASAAMTLSQEGAGTYGDNDRFRGVVPAAALVGGQPVQYWVRADGVNGQTLYDSQNGENYSVTPRALSVGWAGNLGAYDAQGGAAEFYRAGNLLNSDLSTATGCFWEGEDDYQVQAIQVYVPGLTDQGYTGDLATVASALLTAEMWTDLRADGWGAVPTVCHPGVGNNFVCPLTLATFPEGGSCLVDGPVAPGDYEYKVRFSVDNGASWYWVGTADGNGGGDNLRVQYDPGCLYSSNDPFTCEGASGFDQAVVRLTAAVGASDSTTSTFTNGNASTTLTNIRLVGSDTSKFALTLTEGSAPVTATTVTLAAGQALGFALKYTPTTDTTGTLPDMVDVAWDSGGGTGVTTTYALHVRGVTD